MTMTNPSRGSKGKDTTHQVDASGTAGAAAHYKKASTQASQLKGAGATLGGFATGAPTSRTHNTAGKMYAKGKH